MEPTGSLRAEKGTAYPLNSKRLKLKHIQHLARALNLPAAAPRSDLEIMIGGQIREVRGEGAQAQVVLSLSEEGEQLSLRDQDGTFLVAPVVSALPSKASTPSQEYSDSEGDTGSLSREMAQLHTILALMEEEKIALKVELESVKVEFSHVKAELGKSQERVLELWQENCQQLIEFDNALAGKDQEIFQLKERLQLREMELARWKLSGLSGPLIQDRVTTSPKMESVSELESKYVSTTGRGNVRLGEGLLEFPVFTSTHAETGPLSVSRQKGQTCVPSTTTTPDKSVHYKCVSTTTTTTVSPDDLSPLRCVATTTMSADDFLPMRQTVTATNPFNLGHNGHTATVSEGHVHVAEYGSTNTVSLSSSVQSGQQVTKLGGTLFSTPFISRPISSTGVANCGEVATGNLASTFRRGKAPPIDSFTAEDTTITFDDWLLTLERAATWNQWTPDETLMQLAGHLRGRASQEWKLLLPKDKSSYQKAVGALREKLDPGNQTLAALDFRHTSQQSSESVSNFITRLEKVFQIGFGREHLSIETREMLLYGQLQEGLLYTLMESPSVSGAQNYKELCLAAKREERRLAELKKKQHYLKTQTQSTGNKPPATTQNWQRRNFRPGNYYKPKSESDKDGRLQKQLRCYICDSPNHLARQCKQAKTESTGKKETQKGMKVIRADTYLSVEKSGSRSVKVMVEGVPIVGLIDTGSDITIMRGDRFYDMVKEANLDIQQLKPTEQRACTYDQKPITLDGQMDVKITFGDKTVVSTVFVKLVAPDKLLLSENVCRILGIVSYHPDVQPVCEPRSETVTDNPLGKEATQPTSSGAVGPSEETRGGEGDNSDKDEQSLEEVVEGNNTSAVAVVKLLSTVRLPACHSAVVPVQVKGIQGSVLVEQSKPSGIQMEQSLVETKKDGMTTLCITNHGKTTCQLQAGTQIAEACEVEFELSDEESKSITSDRWEETLCESDKDVEQTPPELDVNMPVEDDLKLRMVSLLSDDGKVFSSEHIVWRQQQLISTFIDPEINGVSEEERLQLIGLLTDYHDIFSLNDEERGETDLIEFKIDTGEACPRRQPVRRVPFSARKEIAEQLEKMQRNNVIESSESPWASPVVLVRKRDGSLRFCVDYRALNSVTKPDLFPLPRINDLLDQLAKSKYFSTLDLKSGYWQIRVHPDSQQKTAFITHQGLYQFRVMPFGVTNAPAVFQRLMQRVLADLQSDTSNTFVSVYLDDVIVFSRSLDEHMKHLRAVFDRLRKAGLMLNPSKCKLMCNEVEYLGHVVTKSGLKPNNRNLDAVKNFPPPTNLRQLQQFLGLTSYYRRFVPGYAKLAFPLHALTRKNTQFIWSAECETAFEVLRQKLITSPLLAYPDFDKDFTLETDASKLGLGAILSQLQDDNKLHPVAYASRSLSAAEANYSITDLETLAVVWAVTHFRYYLYGHNVNIFTDHAAVKAILGTPNLTGKHARWWSKLYGNGIKSINIIHRSGKQNSNADCLSRQPVTPAPPTDGLEEVQIAMISCPPETIDNLLQADTQTDGGDEEYSKEQFKDEQLQPVIRYLSDGVLPDDEKSAKNLVAEASLYTMVNGILYYVGPTQTETSRVVVPKHLQVKIMQEHHDGLLSGHFSGPKLYKTLVRRWWWPRMYTDALEYAKNCPQCAIVQGTGRRQKPSLHPIVTERPFQILGVDIMELPITTRGNRYVIVFQDLFTKWPVVVPVPDQKAVRIAQILVEEIIPAFGVPEALLSDRGTNLLSFLMKDVCKMLGIDKLNTTANHPQCNGAVERFNRTLKTMLRKHAAKFGLQWDQYLSGVLWAYRNTPHSSTGEKPSFLLYGFDCRTPTEAAFLPAKSLRPTNVGDYREQMMLSLSSARNLAKEVNKGSQKKYKVQYDKSARDLKLKIGDWVLVYFAQDETGKTRKLSQPWHGPYRIISKKDPDVVACKIYFPDDTPIQIHQSRVQRCPTSFPGNFYWYGSKRSKPGRPPKKLLTYLNGQENVNVSSTNSTINSTSTESSDEKKSSVKTSPSSDSCPYFLRSRTKTDDARVELIDGENDVKMM